MSLMSEYINKNLTVPELESELIKLIAEYNKLRGTYLFVYSSAVRKRILGAALEHDDYYIFHDLLTEKKDVHKIDIYVETHGGSGSAVEDIVKFFIRILMLYLL